MYLHRLLLRTLFEPYDTVLSKPCYIKDSVQ
jgi:hypothetical protein